MNEIITYYDTFSLSIIFEDIEIVNSNLLKLFEKEILEKK